MLHLGQVCSVGKAQGEGKGSKFPSSIQVPFLDHCSLIWCRKTHKWSCLELLTYYRYYLWLFRVIDLLFRVT